MTLRWFSFAFNGGTVNRKRHARAPFRWNVRPLQKTYFLSIVTLNHKTLLVYIARVLETGSLSKAEHENSKKKLINEENKKTKRTNRRSNMKSQLSFACAKAVQIFNFTIRSWFVFYWAKKKEFECSYTIIRGKDGRLTNGKCRFWKFRKRRFSFMIESLIFVSQILISMLLKEQYARSFAAQCSIFINSNSSMNLHCVVFGVFN